MRKSAAIATLIAGALCAAVAVHDMLDIRNIFGGSNVLAWIEGVGWGLGLVFLSGVALASWLLGAAWSLATIFAVPLLALEGAGPLETAKESVHLIKSKWGEGITGLAGIGIWTIFAMVPVMILLAIGVAMTIQGATAGAALVAISVGAMLLVAALSLATQQVFSVALYRYASGAHNAGGFAVSDLEEPFRRRRSRG